MYCSRDFGFEDHGLEDEGIVKNKYDATTEYYPTVLLSLVSGGRG